MWGMHADWDNWVWPMALHSLIWLVGIGLLVMAAAIIITNLTGRRRRDEALATLVSHYSEGKISRDEFLKKSRELR